MSDFANIMNGIIGGSKSVSENQAFPYLQGALSGSINQGGQAGNQIASLLGLNGADHQAQGFDQFRNSTGYQFGMDQGMKSITGGAATHGMLNSGSTLKALNTYGQNYANTQFQNYLNPLQNLMGSGISAANALSGAGQQSKTQSSPGAAGFIGQLLAK